MRETTRVRSESIINGVLSYAIVLNSWNGKLKNVIFNLNYWIKNVKKLKLKNKNSKNFVWEK